MPAVAAIRGSVHSSCGAWCIATSVRASRASDSPRISPWLTPAASGWSTTQRRIWISATSNRRLVSSREPQRWRSASANSRCRVSSSSPIAASGTTITGGSDCTIGLRAPPSKSSVAQVKSGPSSGALKNTWCSGCGYSSRLGVSIFNRGSAISPRDDGPPFHPGAGCAGRHDRAAARRRGARTADHCGTARPAPGSVPAERRGGRVGKCRRTRSWMNGQHVWSIAPDSSREST